MAALEGVQAPGRGACQTLLEGGEQALGRGACPVGSVSGQPFSRPDWTEPEEEWQRVFGLVLGRTVSRAEVWAWREAVGGKAGKVLGRPRGLVLSGRGIPTRGQKLQVQFSPQSPEEICMVREEEVVEESRVEEEDRDRRFYGKLECRVPKGVPESTKLMVQVRVTWGNGVTQVLQALVDTGAEVNLVNPRVADPALFTKSTRPVRLGVANSHPLQGGGCP